MLGVEATAAEKKKILASTWAYKSNFPQKY
jgi:hypothetical protein